MHHGSSQLNAQIECLLTSWFRNRDSLRIDETSQVLPDRPQVTNVSQPSAESPRHYLMLHPVAHQLNAVPETRQSRPTIIMSI
jgi:hypothetical protein